jgi:prepilin-type N-terminal cleavage/methylation domain-containing protein/prepilin-type processing-associated H-X9-DG protein
MTSVSTGYASGIVMNGRAGFTLVEMLMVLMVIGIIVGLLLPAIQSAREVAQRNQCEQHLLQLGIALGNYASTHRVFPPGVVDVKGPISNRPKGYHVGWAVQILPFIEQNNIYRHIDFRRGVYDRVNSTAVSAWLEVFHCPSSWSAGGMSYAGCHHDVEAPIDANDHGVLFLNSHVGYDDITDGPAYTILLGETQGGPALGWAPGTRDTLRNTGIPINAPEPLITLSNLPAATPGAQRKEMEELSDNGLVPVPLPGYVGGFSSYHEFGANFLFCDGSVHFLRPSIEPRVYRCLGYRSDGEVIDGEQY